MKNTVMKELSNRLQHDLAALKEIDDALEGVYAHGWEVITERPAVKDIENLNSNLYFSIASSEIGPVRDVTYRYNDVLVTFDESHTKTFEVLSWETVTATWLKHREQVGKSDKSKFWSMGQCPAKYLAINDAKEAWFEARKAGIADRGVCIDKWVAMHECDRKDVALRDQRETLVRSMQDAYKAIIHNYFADTIPVIGFINVLTMDFDAKTLTLSEQAYDVMYVVLWEEFFQWLNQKAEEAS